MDAAEVVENLSPIGDILPENEAQARPLTELDPEAQRLAWEVVKETAPLGKVTSTHVKSVVSVLKDILKTGAIDAGEGLDIPVSQATPDHLKAAITEETYERMKRQEAHIAERQKHRTDLVERANQASLPTGKYRVIYADPPWAYGNNLPPDSTQPTDHYPAMPLDAICDLDVRELRDENAVLFLWATSPLLPEALEVIRAWGFTYKTSFVWDKVAHNVGHYNSVRHELLLVATYGVCTPDVPTLFDSVITEERSEHSRKPETFRHIIDTIYPYGDRIELFARRAVDGWKAFGNELP
jgi:N6-adenosine-specific RNA methylase IME4